MKDSFVINKIKFIIETKSNELYEEQRDEVNKFVTRREKDFVDEMNIEYTKDRALFEKLKKGVSKLENLEKIQTFAGEYHYKMKNIDSRKIIYNTSTKRQDRFCNVQNCLLSYAEGLAFHLRFKALGLLATLDASSRAASAALFHPKQEFSQGGHPDDQSGFPATLHHYGHSNKASTGRRSFHETVYPGGHSQGACACHRQAGIKPAPMGTKHQRHRLHARDLQGCRASCETCRGCRCFL